MNKELQDFKEFMKRREEASQAYVEGDAEPLRQVVSLSLPATFFGPGGGFVEGANEVWKRYERDAAMFEKGSNFTFEILQIAAADGIGYWTGFMKGTARMRGKDEAIPMNLRVTEVFRRENDGWKMVHRHADPLFETKAVLQNSGERDESNFRL